MTDTRSANDLLNGASGPPAFKFDEVGDTVKGKIADLGTAQVRDFDSGDLQFYPDGKPMMQIVVTLITDEGEEGRLFFKPAMREAVKNAVEEAGAKGLEVGARLIVKFNDTAPPTKKGRHPQKLYKAKYEAPTKSVDVDDLL